MSQTMHCEGPLLVIETGPLGPCVHTFSDMTEAVFQMCANGAFGGGTYGSPEHVVRLKALHGHINNLLKMIEGT